MFFARRFLPLLIAPFLCLNAIAQTEPLSVSLTRYSANLRKGGTHLEWVRENQGWVDQGGLRTVEPGFGYCDSLLQSQQLYSLKKMAERGFLSEEQIRFYSTLGDSLVPEQISFFELKEGNKILATLWSVSAQAERNLNGAQTLLPWMLENKWKKDVARVASTGFKYFWEWGRAAQESAKDIDELIQFAVMSSYRELRALGGTTEEAGIFIHAITPVHTSAYQRRFGQDIVFSTHDPRQGDSILFIPLNRLLDQYPVRNTSGLIQRLRSVSGQNWPDSVYADLIDIFRTTLWSELTYSGIKSTSQHPIVIQNFSAWGLNSIHRQLIDAHLPAERAKAMVEELLRSNYTKKIAGPFHYDDVVEPKGVSYWSNEEGAIEVSGMDLVQLHEDPLYLHRILFAVASVGVEQARVTIGSDAPIKNVWLNLIQHRTKVVMVTRNDEMAEKIRALNPNEEKSWVTEAADDVPKTMRDQLGDDWGTTSHWFVFDFERILEIAMKNPELDRVFEESRQRLKLGEFWVRQKLASHDLY